MTDFQPERVLLAVPPTGLYIREARCQTPIEHMATIALRPPIDLMYAAAAFERGGVTCRLVDYPAEQRDAEAMLREIADFEPQLVVLLITTPGLAEDMAVAERIKRDHPGLAVAAIGAHFNTLDIDALRRYAALDLAFRGEFEPACEELAQRRPLAEVAGLTWRDDNGEPVRNPDRAFVEDLDSIPFPARHRTRNELYVRPDTGEKQTTIVTNRGCPFSCIFCLANQVAGRRNRKRSPDNVVDELQQCVKQYGIGNFLFRSDTFTADKAWVMELCTEIGRRGLDIAWACNSRVDTLNEEVLAAMKRAGCWIVAFGIESGSPEMLERIGKRTDLDTARRALRLTRRVGLLSSVYFLVGLPWETPETLAASERFARALDPDFMEVFYAYPFPGTPLYAECVRLGLLGEGEIPREAYDRPAVAAVEMNREELAEARHRALRRFYLRPRVIARTLARARSPRVLFNYARYGALQLKELLSPRG